MFFVAEAAVYDVLEVDLVHLLPSFLKLIPLRNFGRIVVLLRIVL